MDCYKEEIFGPVLVCCEVDTLEDAIQFTNSNVTLNSLADSLTHSPASQKIWLFSINLYEAALMQPTLIDVFLVPRHLVRSPLAMGAASSRRVEPPPASTSMKWM